MCHCRKIGKAASNACSTGESPRDGGAYAVNSQVQVLPRTGYFDAGFVKPPNLVIWSSGRLRVGKAVAKASNTLIARR
jgi:hypothetical protein